MWIKTEARRLLPVEGNEIALEARAAGAFSLEVGGLAVLYLGETTGRALLDTIAEWLDTGGWRFVGGTQEPLTLGHHTTNLVFDIPKWLEEHEEEK
jgi:hypothetical protein